MTDSPNPTTDVAADLAAAEQHIEVLTESLVDAQLALEDRGWERIGTVTGLDEFDKAYLQKAARQCRASTVINPLIGRAVNLRVAYVWGQGVSIAARDNGDDAGTNQQPVNDVVQAFLDDPSNQAAFTSGQAREELERALATDGNVFLALVTAPLSGRVQVRSIPFGEVDDIILNPEDRDDAWFVKRTYTTSTVAPSSTGVQSTTRTVTVYHPTVGYRPRMRPKTFDNHEIRWDQPVLHVCVNRLDGWKFGIGDMYPAVQWGRMYAEFLIDWAKLMRALAKVAWAATAKNQRGAAQVRSRLGAADTDAGATVVTGEGQKFEAVSKSGATIDADSGRPLAAMVASATDLPVTMLLSDPGVTGARATAETLDKPLELLMMMRQRLWGDAIRAVLDHVIDAAVRAPRGRLRGTVTTDPVTGVDTVELLGGQDRTIDITFPPLDQQDPVQRVEAIVKADQTQKLPPQLVARLLMEALGVDDLDELLAGMLDDNGDWVDPSTMAAARSALEAIRDGRYPAGV